MSIKKLILFCLFLLAILIIRIVFFYQDRPEIPIGKQVKLLGTIAAEPSFKNNIQSYPITTDLGIKIYLTTAQDGIYNYGERVQVIGSLENRLLNNDYEIYTMYMPRITILNHSTGPILAVTNFVRQKIIGFYRHNLPPDSASLLLGIVFGVKEDISESFMQYLQSAGVLHVIAASGMNVTLVGGFLSAFLILFLKRQWAIVLTIAGLVFYAFLAGLQPSIIRATIMGGLVFTSQILGRQYIATYGLFLAAFLMLFISPSLLLDVGFQLSFMATAGLLFLRPIINSLFSITLIKKLPISEDFFTTLAAQAATLPVLLANFGNYSPWSILANTLVLWTIPILMILGGIGAIFSFILEPLARLLTYLCFPLLWYFEKVIKLFPVSDNTSLAKTHWTMTIGYYLILFSLVLFLKKHYENKNK